MTWAAEVQRAATGAVRLARFDEGGMASFDVSLDGFWRSFSAALLLAPFVAVLRAHGFPPTDSPLLLVGLIEVTEYAASWAVFPVVMVFLARFLGLSARYVPFIVAWNWSMVVQIAFLFPIVLLEMLGFFSPALSQTLQLFALVYVLIYVTFVTRTALDTGWLTATGIVFLDVVLELLMLSFAEGLL